MSKICRAISGNFDLLRIVHDAVSYTVTAETSGERCEKPFFTGNQKMMPILSYQQDYKENKLHFNDMS